MLIFKMAFQSKAKNVCNQMFLVINKRYSRNLFYLKVVRVSKCRLDFELKVTHKDANNKILQSKKLIESVTSFIKN